MNKLLVVMPFALLALVACNIESSRYSYLAAKNPWSNEALTNFRRSEGGKLPVLDTSDTLTGIDADNDGIRDDIQAFIDKLDASKEQKRRYREYAKGIQAEMLVENIDLATASTLNKNTTKNTVCLVKGLDVEGQEIAFKYSELIVIFTENTKIRFEQGNKMDHALSGSVWSLPNDDVCE